MKQFILLLAVLAQSAVGSSEKDKWTWPSTATADRTDRADRRKDLLFENIDNDNPSSRIRVPTSYDSINSGRPSYLVKEPTTTNRPKPLSDEFSNEFSSGENYNGINGYNNRPNQAPNRFGNNVNSASSNQPQNDYPPGGFGGNGFPQNSFQGQGFNPGFGNQQGNRYRPQQGQFGGQQGGQNPIQPDFNGGFGGNGFPQNSLQGQGFNPGFGGQQGNRYRPQQGQFGGQFGGQQGGQNPIQPDFNGGFGGLGSFGGGFGGGFGGFGGNYPVGNPANGILVGPGGPTGIIGRPHFGGFNGGFPGGIGFDQQGGGNNPNRFNQFNQNGGQNGLTNGQFNPNRRPSFDSTIKNAPIKHVEKKSTK